MLDAPDFTTVEAAAAGVTALAAGAFAKFSGFKPIVKFAIVAAVVVVVALVIG